ncbi:hypothetical protein Pint_29350 [Pistacia integerrima]|uniref:Uncharacterized protein n=1 Tax=Pistacia integerrima TaxID=434235 RepID=A0ACC0WZZ0_9ROSI|nr:hypothetical protein Pint_29350 [Pistacia integerrima]
MFPATLNINSRPPRNARPSPSMFSFTQIHAPSSMALSLTQMTCCSTTRPMGTGVAVNISKIYLLRNPMNLKLKTLNFFSRIISLINQKFLANPLSSKKLLFVFGDSLFDPGNNQYLNNSMPSASISWPCGMNMNNKSTGRLSDGLLVPDFVALFANLPVDPPCMQPGADLTNGANFASAGAGVLGETNGVNVGPLGCLPSTKAMYPELNGACVKNFLTHPKLHNKALYNKLNKMAKQLPGFKHSIMNYYYALGDRISKSPIYGFKEGKVACCGSGLYNGQNCGVGSYKLCKNPSEYVFFDGGHTTQKTNRQLAELLWSGGPNVTGPYNVKQLFEFP